MELNDLAFTTWTDEPTSREDPGFYLPSTVALERSLAAAGAVTLGELVRPAGRPWKRDEADGTFTYVDISSIDCRTGEIMPTEIAVRDAPSRARQAIASPDLLVSSVRPERNAVAEVPPSLDGAVASTGFFVLRPVDGTPQRRACLFLYLKSESFIRQAVRRCTSSMYPIVSEADLLTILVPEAIFEKGQPAADALTDAYAARAEADREFARAKDLMAAALASVTSAGTGPRPSG